MLAVIVQYLFLPIVFVLTVILPVVWYFVNRKYVWFSVPLAVLVELIINWDNLMYYESRGLMILFTAVQIAVMAGIILILKAVIPKRKQ